jgi:predicted lipoprotein with Yx(FWY)xxD motif
MFEKTSARILILRPAALLAIGALLVAACSSAATSSPAPTATATVEASATAGASQTAGATPTEAASGTSYTVNVTADATLGNYLTGEDGKTLYVKMGDSTSAPNCTGTCLTNWPAFTLDTGETVVAGTGVTGTLATFTRPEGTQVSYNGAPLYYFSGDTAAGETKGQGAGGVWSVAAP